MARFDSANLLELCQFHSGRPATDAATTPAIWYSLLTTAQEHWYRIIATHYPQVLYGAPVQLETDDGGYTYRLPLDGELQVFPMGLAEIRDRRNGRLLKLGAEFENDVDFTPEGTILRVPHGKTRTFSDGPWMRYVAPPGTIAADSEPTLKPVQARILLVFHACWLWANRPPYAADPNGFLAQEQRYWKGDPAIDGDYGIEGMLSTQFLGQDSTLPDEDEGPWWQSPDFR